MTTYTLAPPTAAEGQQILRVLAGADLESLTLTVRAHSPWVQVDAWVHLEGERKLALWRATGAVYAVGSDGAVGDDPIVPGW